MTFMWLNFMKASCIERHRLVMNVNPEAFELTNFVIFAQLFHCSSFIVFNPHSASNEISKSDSMVQFPTMFCMSRCSPIRGFKAGRLWKSRFHLESDVS